MKLRSNLLYSGLNDHISGVKSPRWLLRFAWSHPQLYQLWTAYHHRVRLFDPTYDIVLDGFPRSANSYFAHMLSLIGGKDLRIRSNCHCPPFLLAASSLGLPSILPIRKPEDAVISWVLYRKLPIRSVLELFVDFHRVLLPHRSEFLVVDFQTITEDFPTVVRLINQRYELRLTIPSDLNDYRDEAFAQITRHYQGKAAGFDPLKVAHPHPLREEEKNALRREILSKEYADLLEESRKIYAAFESEALQEIQKLPALPVDV